MMDMMTHCFGADGHSEFEEMIRFMEHHNRAAKLTTVKVYGPVRLLLARVWLRAGVTHDPWSGTLSIPVGVYSGCDLASQ